MMKRTMIAAMLLGVLSTLFVVMPPASSIILRKTWTKRTLAIFTGYRLAVAAFAIWIGWL